MSNLPENREEPLSKIEIGMAWCLGWGEEEKPKIERTVLQEMRKAIAKGQEAPEETQEIIARIKELRSLKKQPIQTEQITDIAEKHPALWSEKTKIGLVYGGVTKVKQYIFESAKLPEIRGASALLDRINLVDLPAFFHAEDDDSSPPRFPQCQEAKEYCQRVRDELYNQDLSEALIPELIIYSTGGNILAMCPAAFINDLADAIERRYSHETITANSCAVGDTFRLLEFRLGLLADNFEDTFWFDKYSENKDKELVKAYYDRSDTKDDKELFFSRKTFNELVGKLSAKFYQRRNGNDTPNRLSRAYPAILETHPYLMRDGSDRASVVMQAMGLPGDPYFSEPLARKKLVGQIAKRELPENEELPEWYSRANLGWNPGKKAIRGWIAKFTEKFLSKNQEDRENYYGDRDWSNIKIKEAQTLIEIGDSCDGFVAYIYADGNNMSGYIQKKIKSAEGYQEFSQDIFDATEKAVYIALAEHLEPRQLKNIPKQKDSRNHNGDWIHPFEIITIGGDDVLIVVPADKALQIAHTIGVKFEEILQDKGKTYRIEDENPDSALCHRYRKESTEPSKCTLSTSLGVLITSYNTPIYYADKLVSQLLKSAKKKAKTLKDDSRYNYHGGTIDFLSLKAVTAISSNIQEFRDTGLTINKNENHTLKLYGAPYTLQEMEGFIQTVKALHESNFPRSQLYQIRSLLERGKRTAILNYRYFRVRLKSEEQEKLKQHFEEAWCKPQDPNNKGSLAPWSCIPRQPSKEGDEPKKPEKTIYETIWRDLVDIYPFFEPNLNKAEAETIPQEAAT